MTLDPDHWAEMRPLLDKALDLSPGERTLWLRAQRLTNPTLVAELEELLAREWQLEQEGFLGPESHPLPPEGLSLSGKSLGPWVLDRPLGQGGMGTVWLARRADGRFEGAAAIKFLSLALSDAAGEARFRREGSALARLNHPNISRLLDAGVAPTGQPYLVLEHVAGVPLDRWCDQRDLSIADRLQVFRQVLDAVTHAHANLIVHRDLKPSNILVTTDGVVKLLDFGIAKMLEEGGETTANQERMLTIEYASPEQVRGEPISTATDVYSLGVLLYQLLGGRHPTGAGSSTPVERIQGILESEPARLSRVEGMPVRVRRTVAGDLDNILAKALRKDPRERYPSVVALSEDLDGYLNHRPVSARPATWRYRAGKFVRRNRGSVASALLITLLLIATTGAAVYQAFQARHQRDAVVVALRRQVALSAVQEVLAGDARGAGGKPLNVSERLQLAMEVLRGSYRNEPWLVAEGMSNLSARYFEMGDRETQRRVLADAAALAEQANLPEQIALARCGRAFSFSYDDALDSARANLVAAKAALARGRADALRCQESEAFVLMAEGHSDSAIPLLTDIVQREEHPSVDDAFSVTERTGALSELAQALRAVGRAREAAEYQKRIVEQLDSTGYRQTGFFGPAVGQLNASLGELGEYAAAQALLASIIRRQETLMGRGQATPELQFLYGLDLLRLGQLDSAELWMGRSLHDPGDVNWGVAMWAPPAMTQLRLDQGRLADAGREVKSLPSGTPIRQANAALLPARLRWQQGDSLGAVTALEQGLRAIAWPGAEPPPYLALGLVTAGEWRLATGGIRAADSLALLSIRAGSVDSLAGTRSALVGRAELLRIRTLRALGDTGGARTAAARAVQALENGLGPAHPSSLIARALRDSLRPQ